MTEALGGGLFPQNSITPSEVQQWTNHRVMEWLRSVDLAEYAPNLRGSGVHGGLMVKLCFHLKPTSYHCVSISLMSRLLPVGWS